MTRIIFDDLYTGPAKGFGHWFESSEKVPVGTVRRIRGILFHAWMVSPDETKFFRRWRANWVPVDEKLNSPEHWRSFYRQVVNGERAVVLTCEAQAGGKDGLG